jgi:SAM-dependent methyltransferase
MPTIEANKKAWNNIANWPNLGEGWSLSWGGADQEWWGTIFPRIHAFVPVNDILEIGPGFGRWTEYLRHLCKQLQVVDLSELCIETCKKRFVASDNLKYYVNDGKSLSMIQNNSVDFAFSFDSLVHADEDAIESYVNELSLKLRKDGVAFIHHSNFGKYIHSPMQLLWNHTEHIPDLIKFSRLARGMLSPGFSWRGKTMTAEKFCEFAERSGMCCISQESVNWSSNKLTDCLSVITPKGSIWERPKRILKNKKFEKEVHNLCKIAELYGAESFNMKKEKLEST